jgi:hypothetical protein
VPGDTIGFARALGLSQRSQLKESKYPAGFALASGSPYTDVTDGFDLASVAGTVPPVPNVVLWHPWPDDLVHASADQSSGPRHVAQRTRETLGGDDFWSLIAV